MGILGSSRGYCITPPKLGQRMVMYNEDGRRRVVTTPVLRLFSTGDSVYAETQNSLYRLEPATHAEIEDAISGAIKRAARNFARA
jgi:hypothetical protein